MKITFATQHTKIVRMSARVHLFALKVLTTKKHEMTVASIDPLFPEAFEADFADFCDEVFLRTGTEIDEVYEAVYFQSPAVGSEDARRG